jgi:hypothetical protein
METIKSGINLMSQRSRATRRIAQYLLVFCFITPIALGIVLPNYEAWRNAIWVVIPIALLWLTYDSIRIMLEAATYLDTFREKAYQRELRVEATPSPRSETAEVFVRQATPDHGTDSTSIKQQMTPADIDAYIKHNAASLTEEEIRSLRDSINNKPGYTKAVLKLLNLTRKKTQEGNGSPSPTVEFSL